MMNNKFEESEKNDLILRGRAGKFNRWDEESKQGEIPDKVFLCPRPHNIRLPKDKKGVKLFIIDMSTCNFGHQMELIALS